MTSKATKKEKYCKILPFPPITTTQKTGNFYILVELETLIAHQLLLLLSYDRACCLMFILLAAVVCAFLAELSSRMQCMNKLGLHLNICSLLCMHSPTR